ncbi:uncharacterized protein LOC130548285 isoform X3 [Triplophysa rosa]|uniref:uncharacterized protein LOC130548285 isoform X3 n=1 Tax=Triplophysa rosa TaxID=992332 RepID=UPI002545E251|nr:uncharacterized protein LOC130548285 isoform X3 [Triplophysa rosa]
MSEGAVSSASVYFCLCNIIANSVFGADADEVKSVSVMEGDSVTLHTDLTELQTDDLIQWKFVPHAVLIAEINKHANLSSIYDDDDVSFKGRLQLDDQTGSLTITDIKITNSGLYKLLINRRRTYSKRFNVTVYARLPVPVIIRDSSQCSSVSKCVLLCSVMNVTHVSLSWYKGKSLLSSICVSDLNIRLSLPLEVEYQDTNTYRCVINNPITNHTQHLHVSDLCKDDSQQSDVDYTKPIGVVTFILCVVGLMFFVMICLRQGTHEDAIGDQDVANDTLTEEVDILHLQNLERIARTTDEKRHI